MKNVEITRITSTRCRSRAATQHRRAKSEIVPTISRRNNSFQIFKSHMQKAWQWDDFTGEDFHSSFDPEIWGNQKRQWYQLHSKKPDLTKFKEPTSLFEHFIIVGLHSDSNLDDPVKNALTRRKTWELENEKIGKLDEKMLQYQGCDPMPIFEPQFCPLPYMSGDLVGGKDRRSGGNVGGDGSGGKVVVVVKRRRRRGWRGTVKIGRKDGSVLGRG
ncbi:hypothetical protein Syun_003658 [Stephania yunnanensis]|uniref:Uncharacterized protein n=1 Tax=Stephania yunnanensis TaxID=152371 RepID=A0AAP0L1P7_9MAGN